MRISDLPGPRGVPLLGNALQIDSASLHLTAEKWSRTYGEVFRFRIGPRQLVVLSNPETIAAALRDRPDGFQRTTRMSRIAKDMGFNGVFSASGEAWRRQRPMVMAGFDPGRTKAYFPALVKVTQPVRAPLAARGGGGRGDRPAGRPDALHGGRHRRARLRRRHQHHRVGHGRHPAAPRQGLARALQALHDAVAVLALARETGKSTSIYMRCRARWRSSSRRRARAWKRIPALRSQPTNLIESMIAARDTAGSGVDDNDVAGNVLTMLLAGEDTTANTLAWMIYLLSRHPEALRRAREEVRWQECREIRGRLGAALRRRVHQRDHASQAGGADPDARADPRHQARRARASGRDADHVPDARRAPPTSGASRRRRRSTRVVGSGVSATSSKRVVMPFGAGPRLCPGRYLAILEMKMVMAMLLEPVRDRERHHARRRRSEGAPRVHHVAGRLAPEA